MARQAVHYFLAVMSEENIADKAWDMLRYDRCYPLSNSPDGWVTFQQADLPGVRGGFTLERWKSFGFQPVTWTGSQADGFRLIQEATDRYHARRASFEARHHKELSK